MRIAHLNLARGFRGGERQTELLIRGLQQFEVQQSLIVRKSSPLISRLANVDIDVRGVSGNLLSAARAIGGADVIHSHEGRGVYAAWLRSILDGTPYILTRRVNNRLDQNWVTRRAYRSAASVAGVAQRIADIVEEYDARISVCVVYSSSSGLSVNEQEAQRIKATYAEKWIVGNVGALDLKQKGQHYIIEVARDLEQSHPDIQFMIVGGGDDEAELRDAAKGLSNLVFTGFVDNVGDFLAAFDLFILPSDKEGIGSILIDAMEQSLPVVASRVGGVPEIVTDGKNGILIERGRVDQLRAGILKLRGDGELCERMGAFGKKIARTYSVDVMAEKYLALYRAALM